MALELQSAELAPLVAQALNKTRHYHDLGNTEK